MIEAKDVTKHYGRQRVLDDASLAVAAGEQVVLTGGNGSGKTTLLHVMMGLRRPDVGHICWKQRPLTDAGASAWKSARMSWGFLPQKLALPPGATVRQLLAFHASLRQTGPAIANRWLERVGLPGTEKHHAGDLSGGMQQRLGIALTLFHEPELIVMDEPDSSLDPSWRGQLADWLDEAAERGAAVLITSQLHGLNPGKARHVHCQSGRLAPQEAEHTA